MPLSDPAILAPTILGLTALIALGIIAFVASQCWNGWLALKERELILRCTPGAAAPAPASARIEIADLKARIRKLEAIASGVDL